MALIVPNATAVGSKFVNINQAEPDSLDLEILGLRTSAIRSGGATTQAAGTITVGAGIAIIQGVPYTFTGTSFPNSAPGSGSAFTLIVVRLSGGVATVTTINGADSSSNPTLPPSKSTVTTFVAADHFDPGTDVALATVFRATPVGTTDGHIVDKRVMYSGSLQWTQATAPTTEGSNGDIVTVGSQIYVKFAGTWQTLVTQSAGDEIVPIGGVIMWPANTNPSSRYVECLGQNTNDTIHPLLAAAWGVTGTFSLPDYRDRVPRGGNASGANGIITTTGGADSQPVPLKNHSHSLSAHTHPINHGHTVGSSGLTADSGAHTHSAGLNNSAVSIVAAGLHSHQITSSYFYNAVSGYSAGMSLWAQVSGGSAAPFQPQITATQWLSGTPLPVGQRLEGISLGGSGIPGTGPATIDNLNNGSHSHTAALADTSVTVNSAGTHNHAVTVNATVGVSSSPPTTDTTNSVGDGAAPTIPTLPAFRTVRYFVRAS